MRVLMVDDHVMVLQGLKNLLTMLVPELQVDTASTLKSAIAKAAGTSYQLVLLDWHLDGSTGAQAFERLRDVGCVARIVVLSGEYNAELVRSAIELGAAGFVPKRFSSEAMVSALEVVLNGGIFLPPDSPHERPMPSAKAALVEAEHKIAGLTPRQIDVYKSAARGLPNKLIARELGIAESTVKTHLLAVYAVLGVRNRTEAAYHASRENIRIG